MSQVKIDQQKLFLEINHYVPIDGYRVFSERENGTHYAVTFLSKDNRRCVLAEIDDFTNPHGAIKIIAF